MSRPAGLQGTAGPREVTGWRQRFHLLHAFTSTGEGGLVLEVTNAGHREKAARHLGLENLERALRETESQPESHAP